MENYIGINSLGTITEEYKYYVDNKIKDSSKAVSYSNYSAMITALNAMSSTEYKTGQDILIVTLDVPDLWVSEKAQTSVPYTYTTDEAFTTTLKNNGYVQVGYYKLSALETQKVDLTDYVTNNDLSTELATKQDTLTAGTGITIDADNVISATGGSSEPIWTIDANGVITGVQNAVGFITIPDEVGGITVTELDTGLFQDNLDITGVDFIQTPGLIVGESAFDSCLNLKELRNIDTVSEIRDYAFRGCPLLLVYSDYYSGLGNCLALGNITTIGIGAFYSTGIKKLFIDDFTQIIDDFAFQYSALEYVEISDYNADLIAIPNSCFYGCSYLKTVKLSNLIETIGSGAFRNCSSLEEITIPDSVIFIDTNVFTGTPLKKITLPFIGDEIGGSNRYLGYLFGGQQYQDNSSVVPESLKEVVLTGIDLDVPIYSFNNCEHIEKITLQIGVEQILNYAFRGCISLKSIAMPDTLIDIGNFAFAYCTSLTSVRIPDYMLDIRDSAFSDCTSLASITIPDMVTSIGSGTFAYCLSLTFIYYNGSKVNWSNITIDPNASIRPDTIVICVDGNITL